MATHTPPHLFNDAGVATISIGVREFQCMGASTPHDHPHVFLTMGSDSQIICPYCSTLYVYDEKLTAQETDPPGCLASAAA